MKNCALCHYILILFFMGLTGIWGCTEGGDKTGEESEKSKPSQDTPEDQKQKNSPIKTPKKSAIEEAIDGITEEFKSPDQDRRRTALLAMQ